MVSRSKTTEDWYLKKASEIVNSFQNQTGQNSHTKLLAWLEIHRSTMTASSWRIYRAALGYTFEQSGHHEMARSIRSLGTERCVPSKSSRRAKQKMKKLPAEDLRKIHKQLVASRSRYAEPTGLLLQASLLTGLRPIEWSTCWIDESNPNVSVLMVRNAKNTNGRSHGLIRKLRLDGLTQNERRIVRSMVDIGQSHQSDWNAFYEQMRKTLKRITKALWPRRKQRPTLYSARHQFTANAKAAGLTRVEIAALMGHASIETAGNHYGRRTAGIGSSGFHIEPDTQDLQNVRDILSSKAESASDQSMPDWHRIDPDEPDLS